MKEKGFFMLFLTKKWINIGFLIIYILLVLIIVPAPTYDNDKLDDYVNINNNQWKFIVVKVGQYTPYFGSNFPVFTIENDRTIHIITTPETESYIEVEFKVPQRGETFSYFFSSSLYSFTTLIDSKGVKHSLIEENSEENKRHWTGSRRLFLREFDISQFEGQNVKIRIQPISSPINAKPSYSYHHYYGFAKINIKQYTCNEHFSLFLNIIINIILFSLIIGFIIGYSGSSLFVTISNKFHVSVKENYSDLFSNEGKWYIKKWYFRYYLKIVFSIANKSLDFADKIHNLKLRTSIKTSILVGLPVIIIYITAIIVYTIIVIIIAILMLALLIWVILEILGGSPSGGSIGGGSGSSNKSSTKGYYEKNGKKYDSKTEEQIIRQDGRTYREDSIRGWVPDKNILGNDNVEKDFFGNPKIERDVFGDQKVEKDIFGNPIVPPKKKR